jgi:hypothetical protein
MEEMLCVDQEQMHQFQVSMNEKIDGTPVFQNFLQMWYFLHVYNIILVHDETMMFNVFCLNY